MPIKGIHGKSSVDAEYFGVGQIAHKKLKNDTTKEA